MKNIGVVFGSFVMAVSLIGCRWVEVIDSSDSSSSGDSGSGSETSATTTTSDVSSSTGSPVTTSSSSSTSGSGGASATATFSLASNPTSGIVVKKSQVSVVGITVTAGDEDITVPSMTLTGQAEIAGSGCSFGEQCAHEAASSRMLSLSLWDGATQVGNAKAPDATTGKAQIAGMNLFIPAYTSKALVVKAHFGSAASLAPYDHVAVGVEQLSDITVLDEDQQLILGSIEPELQEQVDATPTIVHEIRPSGELEIVPDAMPASQIVIAGKDLWVPFAQYRASALYESASIDRLSVNMVSDYDYDPADVTQIAVVTGDLVRGTAVLPTSGMVDVDLSQSPLTVPQDGLLSIEIFAKLAPVVSWNAVPAPSGLPRSGHAFGLTLTSSVTTGEWNSAYSGNLNVRATGKASGERLYAAEGPVEVNPMVVRKTQPHILKQNLSSTTLANIDMDLIKFQVAADSAGAIGLKQVMFNVTMTPGLILSNFRVRRGATDMSLSDFSIVFQDGTDLESGSLAGNGVVVMSFTNEETILGSGNVYTLHANVSGATPGKNVTVGFRQDPSVPIISGSLMSNVSHGTFASSPSIFQLDDAASQGGTADAFGTFLWRDRSEPVGLLIDYTTDALLEDLAQSQTLSL